MEGRTRVGVVFALIGVLLFVCITGISAFHLGNSMRRNAGFAIDVDRAAGVSTVGTLAGQDAVVSTTAQGADTYALAREGSDVVGSTPVRSIAAQQPMDAVEADGHETRGERRERHETDGHPSTTAAALTDAAGTGAHSVGTGVPLSLVVPPRDPAPATRVPTPAMLGNRAVTPAPAARPQPLRAILTPAERELLAHLVYAEAAGEPYLGKVAVAAVVLNRLDHPKFPNTIEGIVFERAAFQPVTDGRLWRAASPRSYQAVDDALRGLDPSRGALYFYNPRLVSADNWIWTRQVIQVIGQHHFAI